MGDFTVEDVREFFTGEYEKDYLYDGIEEFFWNAERTYDKTFLITLNGREYDAKIVETFDDGREYERTMYYVFTIDGRSFKFPGKYYSHQGSEWYPEHLVEGRLVTKPVMVWE